MSETPDPATSIHAACAACDLPEVERWLARDASLAQVQAPETGWTPLQSLATSPAFQQDEAHARASAEIGRRLLALGADANAYTLFRQEDPNSKLPVLYWASEQGNAGLVKVLLEHGANPNDGESVYHAAEHNHRAVLDLLLAHGAEISSALPPWGNTVLFFLAGYRAEHPRAAVVRDGMAWLLEHGADPNAPSYESRETPLHRLVEFGHGPETLEMFVAKGADARRTRGDGRTPYELAMRVGNRAAADWLRTRGCGVELCPVDAFLHACAIGDEAGARRVLAEHPEARAEVVASEHEAFLFAADSGNAGAVRVLASLGLDLGREGPWGGTALHMAAWHGRVEIVRALLAAHAPLDPRDSTYGCSPIAWAAHGSANCRQADDEYAAVVDLLLDAGAARAPSFNRWNSPPESLASPAIAAHLRARGFAPAEPA